MKSTQGKIKKVKTTTVKSRIVNVLRRLWLWSPERRAALKRDGNTCQICGAKQSNKKGYEVKVECHHIKGHIDWDKIVTFLRQELFCSPDQLQTLCYDCHKKTHKE